MTESVVWFGSIGGDESLGVAIARALSINLTHPEFLPKGRQLLDNRGSEWKFIADALCCDLRSEVYK